MRERDHETARQAGLNPFFEPFQRVRGRRSGEDELPVLVLEHVEKIEELFLGPVFPREEVHVVEEERGRATVPGAPPVHPIPLDRRDHFVD